MSKKISVDAAKEMVGCKFDIGTVNSPFSPSRIGGTGNGYRRNRWNLRRLQRD